MTQTITLLIIVHEKSSSSNFWIGQTIPKFKLDHTIWLNFWTKNEDFEQCDFRPIMNNFWVIFKDTKT